MPSNEPEITQIAAVLAQRLPEPGVTTEAAVQAWRGTLRYARAAGMIEEITAQISADDDTLGALCEALEG